MRRSGGWDFASYGTARASPGKRAAVARYRTIAALVGAGMLF
jgi:hypothetical protein